MPTDGNFSSMLGREFQFHGKLHVGGDTAFIATGEAVVAVSDPDLERRLLDEVPPYVGGPYLYVDEVFLNGRIAVIDERVQIVSVSTVIIIREDEGAYAITS